MNTAIPRMAKHPLEKYLIPIILILALAIAGMALSGSKISCGGEGKGIVDLQLAVSQETAHAIKAEWQKPCPKTKCTDCRLPIQFAKINAWLDFIFILIYGLFLAALNYRYNFNDRPRPYRIVSWMILFVCLFDAVENTALMVFLSSEIEWDIFYLVLIPAILKFMLLVIVFVYGFRKILQTITVILKDVFRIFLILPLALISLFVLFFVIWQSDQGQDLLLTINDYDFGPITLYIVLGCLAVMNWHFPKFFWRVSFHNRRLKYFFTHHFTYKHPKELKNIIAVPRLFGVLSFLIPACGILQVFKIFKVKFLLSWISPSALLLILTLLFHLCFRYMWLQTFREKFFKTFLAVCILLALTPFLFWGFNNSEPIDLQWLFYGFLAYAILFALLTSNRVALKDMKVFIFLSDKVITPLTWILVGLCSLAFLIFAVQNVFCVSFDWDTRPTTLAIVISGIILYYALFTILNILGKKYRIAYSGMLLVAILILSAKLKNDYHYVSQVAVTSKAKTITLHDYAARWLRHRDNNYTGDSVYKIYLVNTYGGGIRASAWTCMTVNRLDSLQYLATGEAFQDHVFSYSGASGGTIGAAILCANRYYHKDGVKTNDYINFFSKDYLTHVLVGNLGNDAWYATTGIHGSDRSDVQESIWEKHYADSFGGRLDIAFDDVWLNDTGYRVPLLFSNTTDYKNGRKGIYAPVQLYHNDFPGSTLVRNIIKPASSLKLISGAFLSARFPYLSPAAGIRDSIGGRYKEYHFLDGGMVENSGAETSLQVYNVLKDIADTIKCANIKRFDIYLVSLKNTRPKDDSVLVQKSKNISQIVAPISGAVSIGLVGNTNKAELINVTKLDKMYFRIEPTAYKAIVEGEETEVPLPLGWSISEKALKSMNESLISQSSAGKSLYNVIHAVPRLEPDTMKVK